MQGICIMDTQACDYIDVSTRIYADIFQISWSCLIWIKTACSSIDCTVLSPHILSHMCFHDTRAL